MQHDDCSPKATENQRFLGASQTEPGYRNFRCTACRRQFKERTDTPFNYVEFPTDIVLLVVLWRVRYKLSLRDRAAMFLERGFAFTHEAVRNWEARFAPLIADTLRAKRKGQAGSSWYTDETYIKVGGVWKHLYHAIDRDGNLIDSMLSARRDMDTARRVLRCAGDRRAGAGAGDNGWARLVSSRDPRNARRGGHASL